MSDLTRQHSREKRPRQHQASSSAAAAAAAAAIAQPVQPASNSASDPAACPCVAVARVWLSSAANSLRLRISSATDDELRIEVPSLSLSFSVTLGRPHGISVADECSILEPLESDSYSFLFGDDEAAANQRAAATAAVNAVAGASVAADLSDHDGLSVAEILAFAHAHIQRMDRSWTSPRSRGKRSKSVSGKRADADDDGEDSDVDGENNDGDSDFGAEGGDWGDAEEICALDEVSAEPPVASTPSPLHAAGHGAAAAASSSSPAAAGSSSASAVTVLSKDDVAALQAAMISRVAAALDVIPSSATLLLRKCRWNEDACTARYRTEGMQFAAECGCARTLHELVAPPPDPNSNSNLSADPSTAPASFTCPVCFDSPIPFDRTFALRCGHRLCLPCWCAYLRSEISGGSVSGGSALNTRCAASGCREAVGPGAVELILEYHDSAEEQAEHSGLLARYANLLALSFVDDSDALQWCPASGCEKIVRSTGKLGTVRCGCGKVFCFRCALDAHAPCSCAEAADWTARDKGSANLDTKYLIEQTKPCPNPKCGVRTKKEGGCMFVMCSQCRCSWCWHCGQSGDDHHVWECNRPSYESADSTSEQNRYLFYFERFFNHRESCKTATENLSVIDAKMSQLAADGMHWKHTDFVRHAAELVAQCRRVLAWSYARAFFISDKGARTLFEFRQSELEQYTEKLNRLTEGSLDQLTADRLLVLDWTRALGRVMTTSSERNSDGGETAVAMTGVPLESTLCSHIVSPPPLLGRAPLPLCCPASPVLQYLELFEIDEVSVEKSIPAHAVTTKIEKPQPQSPSSANSNSAAAAASSSGSPAGAAAPAAAALPTPAS